MEISSIIVFNKRPIFELKISKYCIKLRKIKIDWKSIIKLRLLTRFIEIIILKWFLKLNRFINSVDDQRILNL